VATKNKVTVSVNPVKHRPTSSERRAAQIAALSTQQADLKREAAERRARRAENPPAPSDGGVTHGRSDRAQ
jgi:hypothetical protein